MDIAAVYIPCDVINFVAMHFKKSIIVTFICRNDIAMVKAQAKLCRWERGDLLDDFASISCMCIRPDYNTETRL